MKKIQFSAFACLILSAALLPSALANHRTGSIIAPELLVAGDFNHDGNIDLAVNCTGFDVVAILLGDGQGGMTLGGHFPTDTLTKGLQAGDVNRDGHLDLVSATNWCYDENILLGDGLGSFHVPTPPSEIDGDGEPVRLLLRDFNNDGRLDIFVNAPDDDAVVLYFGDGKLDAAVCGVSNTPGQSVVTVMLGDGAGGFTNSTLSVGDLPSSCKIGDLNNDGFPDIVVAGALPGNATGNYITTFLGNGRGVFALSQIVQVGEGNLKGDIALGDFNEDGNLDVAFPKTGSQIPHEHSTSEFIFFGDGHGQLSAGPVLTVEEEPHSVIAVDVNHDGHLDLCNTNRTPGTVTTLLGDGHGNFTLSSSVSVLSPIQ